MDSVGKGLGRAAVYANPMAWIPLIIGHASGHGQETNKFIDKYLGPLSVAIAGASFGAAGAGGGGNFLNPSSISSLANLAGRFGGGGGGGGGGGRGVLAGDVFGAMPGGSADTGSFDDLDEERRQRELLEELNRLMREMQATR